MTTVDFDEMTAPDGSVRTPWVELARDLATIAPERLQARRREAARLLRDDGVTYNVHGDDEALDGAWPLDPLPVVLADDDWSAIERGIAQRAAVLDAVLDDLYGARRLLADGSIPPELVLGHRGFLRACDGIRLPGPHQLVSYAADLVRDSTGTMWVLGDRAEAPSGAAYALENRVVVARVLAGLYRDARVQRLAPFFRSLRASLAAVAPEGVEDPRVVVLSPGRHSETWFEHAYLATHLGWSLVEGADLTVREDGVHLRALGGLEPVHVILRRVDGWYCDPLELRGDSRLGVAGLVEAARRGTVSIVNPIGSSVLENAGLQTVMASLTRTVLDEDPILPSVPTWWCGDASSRSHVLANLDSLVLRPTARRAGNPSLFGWLLRADERAELAARIEAQPHRWVGQEPIEPSTTPTLTDNGVRSRRMLLRSFAVARQGTWTVLPGGLTRVASEDGSLLIAGRTGAISKDTWVVAAGEERPTAFWLHRGPEVPAIEPAVGMPSRAAENLFWLGRYAERAEQTLRLLRCVLDRRTEFAGRGEADGRECVAVLVRALVRSTDARPSADAVVRDLEHDPEPILRRILLDPTSRGSLAADLRSLQTSAQAVRDQLSGDTWLVLSNLERELDDLRRAGAIAETDGSTPMALAAILKSLLAVAGLATESMVRDPGWRFMDAGRRIERTIQLSALLGGTLDEARGTAVDSLVLESVLTAAESIITYRRRYRSHAQVETVLDLLLLDGNNPRAAAFQLDRLNEDLDQVPRSSAGRRSEAQRLSFETSTRLRTADTAALAEVDPAGRRPELTALLTDTVTGMEAAATALDAEHFTHLPTGRLLIGEPAAGDDLLGSVLP